MDVKVNTETEEVSVNETSPDPFEIPDEETHLDSQTQELAQALQQYNECKVTKHNADMAFINARQELTRKLIDAGVNIKDLEK